MRSPETLPSDTGDGPVDPADVPSERSTRAAAWAFAAYLVVAFPVLLHLGRDYWFAGDEWAFIVGQDDLADLFRPLQTHWSTVPILVYQALFRIVGLHSYLPYQAVVVLLHLSLAALLRVVMRRGGVSPWIATVAAGTFVLYGTAEENIHLGVQVSMMASMVAGFGQLLLADHDGPADRRDGLGLACGLLALMSSGVGIVMVAVAGLATLVRRGWRAAALHTVPLAAVYGVWYLAFRSEMAGQSGPRASAGVLWDWVVHGTTGVFVAMGQHPVVGVALAAVLVGGLVMAWAPLDRPALRRSCGPAAALLLGAVVLLAAVGSQRWILGTQVARASHYMGMATAMVLPALAVAVDALARRHRFAGPVLVVLLLLGVPGNLDAFGERSKGAEFYAQQEAIITGAPHSTWADAAPADLQPDPRPIGAEGVTMGFLADAWADGRLADPRPLPPALESELAVRLGLQARFEFLPPGLECRPSPEPVVVDLRDGDIVGIQSVVRITNAGAGAAPSGRVTYDPWLGQALHVLVPELRVQISAPPGGELALCLDPASWPS